MKVNLSFEGRGRFALLASGLLWIAASTQPLFAVAAVTSFGAVLRNDYSQNSSAAPSTGGYAFYAEVLGSNLGDLTTRKYADPSLVERNLSVTPNGERATDTRYYADSASRNAAYPPGNYKFTLDSESVTVGIAPPIVFPNTAMILGGTWTGGRLQVSDTGYTFNFNTPVGANLVRLYLYQQAINPRT